MNVPGDIMSLAHYSVKEYFCSDKICAGPASKFHVDQSDANASVAEACITYLLQMDGPVDNSSFNEAPLACYAASYWHIHAQAGAPSPNSKNLQPVTLQLLQSNEKMAKVRRLAKPHYPHRSWTDKPALHWAAQYGLTEAARLLLTTGADPTHTDALNRTALHLAVRFRQESIIPLLLTSGLNINAYGGEVGTALNCAVHNEAESIVRMCQLSLPLFSLVSPCFPILLSLGLFGPLIIPPKHHYYTTYSPLYQAKQLV